MEYHLRIHGASQLVLICSNGERVLCGEEQKSVATLESGKGLSVIVDKEGRIHDFGEDSTMSERYEDSSFKSELDASGMCVLPGQY